MVHSDAFLSEKGVVSCLGVYAAWHWSTGNLQSQTHGLWKTQPSPEQRKIFDILTKHFTLKLDDVKQERWWTLITPAFSHIQSDHIFGNLLAFSTFSRMLLTCGIGPLRYGLLILGSAVSGHLAFLYQASLRQPRGWAFFTQRAELQALGLSGVVMGLGVAVSLAAPRAKILVFGAVPMPVWLLMVLYIVYDSAGLEDPTSTVGHAAHLGGAAFGAAFYLLALRNNAALPFSWLLKN
ncbi:uncharacterized protein Z518_09198 [Rhinocladiella mackenziei CBS 650.93]|uniref:Rhinocladiella mackenziei CBS 650.93 unplaced genomic scaffold supercont1.7, whole genome shotgun sequence n=1 Tax=Rhinocladiella mackenziei CBS 650.93 TaxID=1442369 RepID=A0A0D2FHL9_9EURO|nr:uncharacterized protein Z518_09198 [Rhinocladiella mackenziei CBS 650.93]KIX01472.1 hypothetical protein Z518_09198 [Rhinocladiella mackenziei CBS 650.93]